MLNYGRSIKVQFIKDIQEADIIIAIRHSRHPLGGGMQVLKNRDGTSGAIDLPKLLEIILPHQETYLHSLLQGWIEKLKIYRLFS